MKGEKSINQQLNGTLKLLLTGINQYFLHSRMCQNWGLDRLKSKDYDYSIYLMKAADKVIKRVLFLEGLPNLQALGKLYIGEDVPQILDCNIKFEHELREKLIEAIAFCEENSDFISRETLSAILHEVEEQIDWLEAEIDQLAKMGVKNYLQSATS